VFCASLADVFEDREELRKWRYELFSLIADTPALDWLLLTKRPENIVRLWPHDWIAPDADMWPHVWLGTTVENQEMADKRIPELLKIPAVVRFLSCEPLLGPIDVSRYLRCESCLDPSTCWCADPRVNWVITGGESGPNARPSHPDWFRALRDQCLDAHVAYFHKQNGEWWPSNYDASSPEWIVASKVSTAGQNLDHNGSVASMFRVGKKVAGRLLDGVEYSAFPEVVQ
jgi:protein gp37